MTYRRSLALLISAVVLVAAACASPTAPSPKGCDVTTTGGGGIC